MERSPRKTRGLPLGRIHPGLLIAAPQANRLAGVLAPEEEFLLHLREPPVQGEFHQEAPVGPVIRPMQRRLAEKVDRKSTVAGKSESVRVDLGGRRRIKKK